MKESAEHRRLNECSDNPKIPWRLWGPYLSERQWGTVREDYSADGNAWDYFSHEQSHFRAYVNGEDGLGGVCDARQRLCLALALWNGKDGVLKERLFGLANSQGNHGEDVKECYHYLDSTPTHSYMRFLYRYPQAEFPYAQLVEKNRARSRTEPEYELEDTGIFEGNRHFDIFVEYAKAGPEDLLVRIVAHNRGPEDAPLHVLPTLWFRQVPGVPAEAAAARRIRLAGPGKGCVLLRAEHPELGVYHLAAEGDDPAYFTENETNLARLNGGANRTPYVKDAFHERVIRGRVEAVNPEGFGTKAATHRTAVVPAGGSLTLRLRLSAGEPPAEPFGEAFDAVFRERLQEADAFFDAVTPDALPPPAAQVMRQALSGMLWSKQYFEFDGTAWLRRAGDDLSQGKRATSRNAEWRHMYNADVISMPDKWEYPWYAAWDLAFHCLPLSLVDLDFAKEQLRLFLTERYQHPNGQIPAYEWNFSDVNPPVHAWAVWHFYSYEKELHGKGDISFLKSCFPKLLMNFSWWANRKDPEGKNVFGGGFLGLDNIGVFDRSRPLPTGGHLEQSDGTSWMAFFCAMMLQISIELAIEEDPVHEDMAIKFFDHYLWIVTAMDNIGPSGDKLWDEGDGFFYDLLRLPDGSAMHLKVRSLVGLLPLAATALFRADAEEKLPRLGKHARWFMERQPHLARTVTAPLQPGAGGRRLLSLVNEGKLRRILEKLLDEKEFLSPHGIRSLSRIHLDHPYVFKCGETEFKVGYVPGDSDTGMFGGNSNWRGPVWMPMNFILIRGLMNLYSFYGDAFTVEFPTGSGERVTLLEVARRLVHRLSSIFLPGPDGTRPALAQNPRYRDDPHWRDTLLFHEYFHGDTGAGLGATHQTGWTGLIASLLYSFSQIDAEDARRLGAAALYTVSDEHKEAVAEAESPEPPAAPDPPPR